MNYKYKSCLLSLCLVFALLEPAHAKSRVGEAIEEGFLSEFASMLAELPGLDFVVGKIDENRVEVVTSPGEKNRSMLLFEANTDIESISLYQKGASEGYRIISGAVVPAGRYTLHLKSSEKGYSDITRLVNIQPGKVYRSRMTFWKTGQKTFPLHVYSNEKDIRVRVLNIAPKYVSGMLLEPGNYKIEVSSAGGARAVRDVRLDHNQQTFFIPLNGS